MAPHDKKYLMQAGDHGELRGHEIMRLKNNLNKARDSIQFYAIIAPFGCVAAVIIVVIIAVLTPQ